jgi:hypothetical protein
MGSKQDLEVAALSRSQGPAALAAGPVFFTDFLRLRRERDAFSASYL